MIIALSIFILSVAAIEVVLGKYMLQDNYIGQTFFEQFTFFNETDPTHGFVQYQNLKSAQSSGLVYTIDDRFIMKADNVSITPSGRPSVRISSKKAYNSGLFVFDVNHVPTGCSTWPAYWLVGPSWPTNGEIDILEGVHTQTKNTITLHTDNRCTMAGVAQSMTGTSSQYKDCDVNASNQPSNTGCGVTDSRNNSFGSGLNNIGGGVYILLWNTSIQVWFFPRNAIPKDITSGEPSPSEWGLPVADFPFGESCSSTAFKNMNIVIDLTFCGDWAGLSSATSEYNCPVDCNAFVQNNPSAFTSAYWDINSLKVYQV
ncbi:hypothetical protein G6F43_010305 [Rhizopus delemar]|nr:hypothetical protein G6F43_010305 [Rhizopus delemar]